MLEYIRNLQIMQAFGRTNVRKILAYLTPPRPEHPPSGRFLAMTSAQLTCCESLRDIETVAIPESAARAMPWPGGGGAYARTCTSSAVGYLRYSPISNIFERVRVHGSEPRSGYEAVCRGTVPLGRGHAFATNGFAPGGPVASVAYNPSTSQKSSEA